MIILDPDRDGCVVWIINPYVKDKNRVTRIKGTIDEVCKQLIYNFTEYKRVKNQWGNYFDKLFWKDYVYLDTAGMGRLYKDILECRHDLPVEEVRACNLSSIIHADTYL